jgi:hypothetical protein
MEQNDSPVERKKCKAELAWQDRELSIKERESELRKQEAARSRLNTPLGLAVVGAIPEVWETS